MGQALAGLAEQGVLVLASGKLTHNLRNFMAVQQAHGPDTPDTPDTPDAPDRPGRPGSALHAPAYVQAFADWVHTQLMAGDVPALLAYRQQASGQRAHPSDKHLLPLFNAGGQRVPTRKPRRFSGASATTSSPWTATPFADPFADPPLAWGKSLAEQAWIRHTMLHSARPPLTLLGRPEFQHHARKNT